jgi:hypothetical protein
MHKNATLQPVKARFLFLRDEKNSALSINVKERIRPQNPLAVGVGEAHTKQQR